MGANLCFRESDSGKENKRNSTAGAVQVEANLQEQLRDL